MSKKNTVAAKSVKKTTKSAAAQKPTTETLTNPYRVGGGYWASVEALRTAGINQMHSFDKLVPMVKKAMGETFKAFASKDARNENGKDATARMIQNLSVIARTKDYGKPLIEKCGLVAHFNGRNKTAGLFEIGQEPTEPKVETVKAVKPAAKPATKTAKKAKVSKAKPKTAQKAK